MGRETKIGIIVMAIVFVVSVAYTAFYLFYGLQRVDRFNTVLLIAAWIAVAALLIYLLRRRSLVREELVRRYYISGDWIYNHEIGYAPISKITPTGDAYEFITFAAESLAEMSYGFEVADPPEDFQPELLVASCRFRVHNSGEGVVIDKWRGTLQRVGLAANGERAFTNVGSFSNAKELARLLEEEGVFAHTLAEPIDGEIVAQIAAGAEDRIEAEAEALIARALEDIK